MSKKCYIDLETTGLDPKNCGIYQLAAIVEIDDVEVDSFSIFINPGDVIVDDFVKGMLKDRNLDLASLLTFTDDAKAFDEFKQFLSKYVNKFDKNDKFVFTGYNALFDKEFVRAWFLKHGDNYYGSWFWPNVLDVMVMATYTMQEMRHKLPNFQLSTLCKLFNIPIEAHDALEDIRATKHLLKALKDNCFTIYSYD